MLFRYLKYFIRQLSGRFSFSLRCKRKRFVEAIAGAKDLQFHGFSHQLWANYSIGLYATVLRFQGGLQHWKGFFACVISLAACGRHEEASEAARKKAKCYKSRKDFYTLADALAPFMPELALKLIENASAPISLRIALLQRNGRCEESNTLLSHAFEKGEQHDNPELYLYLSNSQPLHSQKRLTFLSAFLDAKGLPPVTLIKPDCSLALHNLSAESDLPDIHDGPLVTVLMTAHQSKSYIGSAIQSILQQTWRNLELIVIDDASTDNTVGVVKDWRRKDPRVRITTLSRNVGTYVAKNIGLQQAKGEFVTCHDADDWSHPLKIERQVTPLLRNRKLVCTISDWVRMQDDGTYYARPVHPLQRFNPSSPLFRRKEVLETTGAWDCVRTGADSEFAARLKIVFGRKAVLRIKQPLSFGAHRPGSLMTCSATGYTEGRVPPDRLDYWESWTHWHINELRAGRKPRMPGLLEERSFEAPRSIRVPREHIIKNYDTLFS